MKLVASSSLNDSFWAKKSNSSPPDTLEDTGGEGPGPVSFVGSEAWLMGAGTIPDSHVVWRVASPSPCLELGLTGI